MGWNRKDNGTEPDKVLCGLYIHTDYVDREGLHDIKPSIIID